MGLQTEQIFYELGKKHGKAIITFNILQHPSSTAEFLDIRCRRLNAGWRWSRRLRFFGSHSHSLWWGRTVTEQRKNLAVANWVSANRVKRCKKENVSIRNASQEPHVQSALSAQSALSVLTESPLASERSCTSVLLSKDIFNMSIWANLRI